MFPYWLHTFYWSVWLKTPDFGLAIEFVPSLQRWNNFIVDKHGQCDCLTSMSVFESDQFVIQHTAISFFPICCLQGTNPKRLKKPRHIFLCLHVGYYQISCLLLASTFVVSANGHTDSAPQLPARSFVSTITLTSSCIVLYCIALLSELCLDTCLHLSQKGCIRQIKVVQNKAFKDLRDSVWKVGHDLLPINENLG